MAYLAHSKANGRRVRDNWPQTHAKAVRGAYTPRHEVQCMAKPRTRYDRPEVTQQCASCLKTKTARYWRKDILGQPICNTCRLKKYYNAHPELKAEKQRRRDRVALLGLRGWTRNQFDEAMEAQGGVCAICLEPEMQNNATGAARRLSADHDHATGRPRGLLCAKCNPSLHRFESLPNWAERALAYLAKHGTVLP